MLLRNVRSSSGERSRSRATMNSVQYVKTMSLSSILSKSAFSFVSAAGALAVKVPFRYCSMAVRIQT